MTNYKERLKISTDGNPSTIFQRAKDFGGWFITIAGGLFLANEFYGIELSKLNKYLLPAVLVLLGIFVILRRKKK